MLGEDRDRARRSDGLPPEMQERGGGGGAMGLLSGGRGRGAQSGNNGYALGSYMPEISIEDEDEEGEGEGDGDGDGDGGNREEQFENVDLGKQSQVRN